MKKRSILCILCVLAMLLSMTGCKIVLGVRQVPVTKLVEKSSLNTTILGTGLGAAGAQLSLCDIFPLLIRTEIIDYNEIFLTGLLQGGHNT